MKLAAFFHCWVAAGTWRPSTFAFLDALEDSSWPGPLFVGLVGSPAQRTEALQEIRARYPAVRVAAEADSGFEQVTIHALHDYTKQHDDGAVLYGHTKGSWHGGNRTETARVLIDKIVRRWRSRLIPLQAGWDVTGDPENNFWMARCDFLRSLPRCRTHNDNGEIDREFAQAGLDGGWFFTGPRHPRGYSAGPLLWRLPGPVGGGDAEPLWRIDNLPCPSCNAGAQDSHGFPLGDTLVINDTGQPILCSAPARCPMALVGRGLLELEQQLGRSPDLEDVAELQADTSMGLSCTT
jgi:hypothetical protein